MIIEAQSMKLATGEVIRVKSMNDVDELYYEVVDEEHNSLYRVYKIHIVWIYYR